MEQYFSIIEQYFSIMAQYFSKMEITKISPKEIFTFMEKYSSNMANIDMTLKEFLVPIPETDQGPTQRPKVFWFRIDHFTVLRSVTASSKIVIKIYNSSKKFYSWFLKWLVWDRPIRVFLWFHCGDSKVKLKPKFQTLFFRTQDSFLLKKLLNKKSQILFSFLTIVVPALLRLN
jgi:hypothetical protein